MIFLVTGEKNQGKTRYMQSFFEEVREGDGFICPKVFENGEFIRYDIKRLSTGETQPFAVHIEELPENWEEGCRYQYYSFSKGAIQFAEDIIHELIESNTEPIIIDEVGPLEIEQREGFYQLTQKVIQSGLGAFISIRKHMSDQFATAFDVGNINVIPVGMEIAENQTKLEE